MTQFSDARIVIGPDEVAALKDVLNPRLCFLSHFAFQNLSLIASLLAYIQRRR